MPHERTVELAKDTQEYLRAFLQLADQKAAFMFAACSAALGFLYTKNAQSLWLSDSSDWSRRSVLGAIAMVALAIAIVSAIAAIAPREVSSGRGVLYWKSILSHPDTPTYIATIRSLSEEEVLDERLYNCRDLARICNSKYRLLRGAVGAGAIGAVASIVFLLSVPSSKGQGASIAYPSDQTTTASLQPAIKKPRSAR